MRVFRRQARPLAHLVGRWRDGSFEGQVAVLAVLTLLAVLLAIGAVLDLSVFPPSTFAVPLVLGSMLLRFRPLLVLVLLTAGCLALAVGVQTDGLDLTPSRVAEIVTVAVVAGIVLVTASQYRSGLPGVLGESMLADLNTELRAQGAMPSLPAGWASETDLRSAGGAEFAGDFLVTHLSEDRRRLELVLVDVSGKGVPAGRQSLQFAGAMGGLLGALHPMGMLAAANDFLLRRQWDDTFATAVHVGIDLETGEFSILSAGHPPALCWRSSSGEWVRDLARGPALGIADRPEFKPSEGVLGPGDALLLLTDGVVERRGVALDDGIDDLLRTAGAEVRAGVDGIALRIQETIDHDDDDRSVVVVHRTPGGSGRRGSTG